MYHTQPHNEPDTIPCLFSPFPARLLTRIAWASDQSVKAPRHRLPSPSYAWVLRSHSTCRYIEPDTHVRRQSRTGVLALRTRGHGATRRHSPKPFSSPSFDAARSASLSPRLRLLCRAAGRRAAHLPGCPHSSTLLHVYLHRYLHPNIHPFVPASIRPYSHTSYIHIHILV
jgi:hypothetical protein